MHIELTDHLRCPAPHDEAFVILLPDRMDGRDVVAGHLGCPRCGWGTAWQDGVPDFGGAWVPEPDFPLDAEAVVAMLGLDGPGGWVALAGEAAALAATLGERLPGVSFVVINPPAGFVPTSATNVLRSGAWPLKRHSMRGVVLGASAAPWATDGALSALHGRQAVGIGSTPADVGLEVMAEAGGVWVVRVR